ncbi:MAG: DUF892 family protein [Alphaproteobacteria bacterium]
MVTFVGMREDFGEELSNLLELEYDALEAYEAAVNRLSDKEYKDKLSLFMQDHQRHIEEISKLLESRGLNAATGPSIGKQWVTKGKVVLANLVGDLTILRAMHSNEIDTNTAYERMYSHDHHWPEAKDMLRRALSDEKRHKEWLNQIIEDA